MCASKTLSWEIVQENDFSDTAYNSAYVSDVNTFQQFFGYNFLTQDRNAW